MRTKKQLLEEATFNGNWQTSGGAKATFEVLCDIRLILANIAVGQGYGYDEVLKAARELVEAEDKERVTSSSEKGELEDNRK